MITLGIESTAHTFGVGIVKSEKNTKRIIADAKDTYRPEKTGLHPNEARMHHERVKESVLEEALEQAALSMDKIDVIAYAKGPGLPPALKVGVGFAKELAKKYKKPLIEVNHPVAHIEVGKFFTGQKDPIVLYASGGNTQIIGYAANTYHVFGETQDIPIGNAIDTFMRECAGVGSLGGPEMERLAKEGKNYIELPYVVKGMDLSFSGILTSAIQKFKKNSEKSAYLKDLCFSFQETCYAMLVEVTERALAHTGKKEVLVTGGVAASKRLGEMLKIMCDERGAAFATVPSQYAGDNGSMIAIAGAIAYEAGQLPIEPERADFDQRWRVDQVNVVWMK